jgi:predicted permease
VDRIYFDRPAEVVEPERLLRVWRSFDNGVVGGSLGNPDYAYYRERASTLSGLAAWDGPMAVSWSAGSGESDQLDAWFVSDNYFDVLGVRPASGRFFLPEENATPGTHFVAVLSHGFWQQAFGADPDVLGRSFTLNARSFTVIGVAPERFQGMSPVERNADVWVPIATYGALARIDHSAWWERNPNFRSNWLYTVGRLAPGVTFEAAEADFAALSEGLEYEGRGSDEDIAVSRQYLYTPSQARTLGTLSTILLAVVGIVLAIAAANVAVLLLSRASTRGREMGIRTAVGAGRTRILRLVFAESLLLGLAGGALGVGLAFATADLVASLLPFTFAGSFTPDLGVLGAAFLLSVLTATVVGLAPAAYALRADVTTIIDGGRVTSERSRARDLLVVGQVALSLVLVAGAALFAQSFLTARGEDLGFETEDRLVLPLNLGSQGYDEARARSLIVEALDRLLALPGVTAATTTMMIPFQGEWTTSMPTPAGGRATDADGDISTGVNVVGPDYFEVAGIPIVRGRALGAEDGPEDTPAIVINEALAEAVWPEADPLGRTLPMQDREFVVVGVARDATYYELGEAPKTQVYGSVLQVTATEVTFVVASSGPAADLAPAAQAAIRQIDPTLAFGQVSTMEAVLEDQIARYEVTAILVGTFGALALALAAAGLYGVISFIVAQRTREIGVKMALGADRGRVAGEVMRRGIVLATVGVLVGLAGVLATRRFTASLLYGVEPQDPLPLVLACSTLVVVAALASLAPARKAMRVDPMEAVRSD